VSTLAWKALLGLSLPTMSIQATLRLNMTGLADDPQLEAERYRAAIEMAEWADAQGFGVVNLEEHHCAENGWLPSPLLLAAMIVARTQRIRVSVSALLAPLYEPIRLAEDIAVLDLVSGGRFSFVAGLGYRPLEYHAMGKSWADRGKLMDEIVETLLDAWTGEPFEFRGERIRVTPVPLSRPHPFFMLGGGSRPAARRAARFGLPFCPALHDPEIEAFYHAELERHGRTGLYYSLGEGNTMLFVDEDPERAWQDLAPFFLRELQEYGGWKVEGVPRPKEEPVRTLDDLRRQKRFEILHPDDARARFESEDRHMVVLHPLVGGVPLDRAWRSLRLFAEKVWSQLRPVNGA
jgi:alkanesulfonate monooxygenase SsuD/methylene tetrahydromethanopterin reductase-like flavin-dependent oxidoreductase (luciferase family)